MYQLKRETKVAAIHALTEGMSIRSVERMTGAHRDTIMRLMVRVGTACRTLLDDSMRNLECKRVEVDEQWTFVLKKHRRLAKEDDQGQMGDFWIWTAIDPESKAVLTHRIGKRDAATANAFVEDLASRLKNRVQLSADGLALYVDAIERAFGGNVDFGQIVKSYETEPIGPGRYSPPRVSSVERTAVVGQPYEKGISTSMIERLHLSNRMRCRRLTRLVDAHSKKLENLEAAVGLAYATYNLVRRHTTLKVTPAMALGISSEPWSIGDLVTLSEGD